MGGEGIESNGWVRLGLQRRIEQGFCFCLGGRGMGGRQVLLAGRRCFPQKIRPKHLIAMVSRNEIMKLIVWKKKRFGTTSIDDANHYMFRIGGTCVVRAHQNMQSP